MKTQLSRRGFTFGVGAAVLTAGCGGGGGGSDSSPAATPTPAPAPVPTPPPPPPPPAPAPGIVITASATSAQAMSPLYVTSTGVDLTQPYQVNFTGSGGSTVALKLIRVDAATSTIVAALPLVIDGPTGATTALSGTLTVTQGSLTSNGLPLSISDLPALSDLGTSPGQFSRAFNSYQTLALAANINMQQATQLLPGAQPVANDLIQDLQSMQTAAVNARNVIDNIVQTPGYVHSIGTAFDATPIRFDANSASVMDRMLACYLAAGLGQSPTSLVPPAAAPRSRLLQFTVARRQGRARASASVKQGRGARASARIASANRSAALARPEGLTGLLNAMGVANAVGGIVAAVQTNNQKNADGYDKSLAFLSAGNTVIQVGATLVATAAVAAAAPEIAAGALVVAGWSSLAGVAIGGMTVANDLTNAWTSYSKLGGLDSNSPEYKAAYNEAKDAAISAGIDAAGTLLNLIGADAKAAIAAGSALPSELTVLGQILAPSAEDVAFGVGGLITTGATIWNLDRMAQNQKESSANSDQAPIPGSSLPGFALVDGSTVIANANGPIMSPLTGLEIGSTSTSNALTTLAGEDGNYVAIVPVGSSSIDYPAVPFSAYDPLTNSVLGSELVDLSSLTSATTISADPITGTCVDMDAADPDGDDPDCD